MVHEQSSPVLYQLNIQSNGLNLKVFKFRKSLTFSRNNFRILRAVVNDRFHQTQHNVELTPQLNLACYLKVIFVFVKKNVRSHKKIQHFYDLNQNLWWHLEKVVRSFRTLWYPDSVFLACFALTFGLLEVWFFVHGLLGHLKQPLPSATFDKNNLKASPHRTQYVLSEKAWR